MKRIILFLLIWSAGISLFAQDFMTNISGRNTVSLNGRWGVIIDPYDFGSGSWAAIWKDQKPTGKTDFFEYSYEGGPVLDVPGDFNSQMPELKYLEGSVWYKKTFTYEKKPGTRLFIHFGAANYKSDVYLNSEKIGSHEGGFTPFQFELTDKIIEGENDVIVRVNNQRVTDGIPALGFDWFNYGGLTRDVTLVETPSTFIDDYYIQLQKGTTNTIAGYIQLNGSIPEQSVEVSIPEAKILYKTTTDVAGKAEIRIPVKNLQLWSPENPKLYQVLISSVTDKIREEIGFRTIEVKGLDILLNGQPVFLKGVSFHEEMGIRKGRAYTPEDAATLLGWAKELGCNFIRLSHYPQNELTVRMAEKMGFMMWEEIPVYQGIDFGDSKMQQKLNFMLREMIRRDKNRCGIIIWSMSNETSPGRDRDACIVNMAKLSRSIDPTRLIASAFDKIDKQGNVYTITDTLSRSLDVISVNEYVGWYNPWPSGPGNIVWKSLFEKPLIVSEFGGEALYGNHGPADVASSWSEEYQEQLYKDQVAMFKTIPFLRGTCPWILVDFLSPRRMLPYYQDGFNRKGLLSDKGYKKKAWYVMKDFYSSTILP